MTAKLVLATPEQIKPLHDEAKQWSDENNLFSTPNTAVLAIVEFQLNQRGFTMYDNRATYKEGARQYYGNKK